MTEISLQSYENEIDQLIEQDRYVEALVHIRYLLSQSPHYVGAYYLLGKALLEADLPELAVDMFRRALSADPEHLLSRIGLGLAHERQNDLDGALLEPRACVGARSRQRRDRRGTPPYVRTSRWD